MLKEESFAFSTKQLFSCSRGQMEEYFQTCLPDAKSIASTEYSHFHRWKRSNKISISLHTPTPCPSVSEASQLHEASLIPSLRAPVLQPKHIPSSSTASPDSYCLLFSLLATDSTLVYPSPKSHQF